MEQRLSDGFASESVRFYLPSLDGLRVLAFVLVFVLHMPTPPAILAIVHQRGWIGVELFSVISSFLFFRFGAIARSATAAI
jgi:peptidoglycan/LPS O-acetylase OafA/YrhL